MNKVWTQRKRWTFFALPFTFTKYTLTDDKILVDTGFLNKQQEEVRLYRILDFSLSRSFGQRIFGLGTITCKTADKTTPELVLKNIKKSSDIKELISSMVETERDKKRVTSREFMSGYDDDDNDNDIDDNE